MTADEHGPGAAARAFRRYLYGVNHAGHGVVVAFKRLICMPGSFSMIWVFSAVVLIWLMGHSPVQAEWTLTTADFVTSRVELKAIGEAGVRVEREGRPTTIPFSRFLLLERSSSTPAPSGALVLHLHMGQKFVGSPRLLDDQTLVWFSPVLGELHVGIDQVKLIARDSRIVRDADTPELQDVLLLTNRDVVRGVLAELSDQFLAMQTGQGEIITVPLSALESLTFAMPAGVARPVDDSPFRVKLNDGSIVTVDDLRLRDDRLSFNCAGVDRVVPLDRVVLIEQQSGPVKWLSSMDPVENIHRPFLSVHWPARMNTGVSGEPIRFGQQVYRRGIGVHSFSRLTFRIPPGYTHFRTRYAIDGERPYADVTIRVLLDEQVVHEVESFRAGVLSPVIDLPLGDARTITLEVDYGQGFDVQDRLNWIEPALVR